MRRFLYSALVTVVLYAVLAVTVPLPEFSISENHQYALPPTGDVKVDFLDLLPAGEVVRVTVNVTHGGPIDVYVVQMNETYDALFEEGAFNATASIPGILAYSAQAVGNYSFSFENDGIFQYAVFLDNRPYADLAADPLDQANATYAVVRARFTEERERAAVLVGLLTTLPAILLPTYAAVRKVRNLRRARKGGEASVRPAGNRCSRGLAETSSPPGRGGGAASSSGAWANLRPASAGF